MITVRLSSPVRASWVASCSSIPSIIRRSVMSVNDTTAADGPSPTESSAWQLSDSQMRAPSGLVSERIRPFCASPVSRVRADR